MTISLLGRIAACLWIWAVLRYGAIALAIVLFFLSIRRTGECAGRISERLEITEKAPMKSNDGCWRRRLAVLVIATSWLTGCAMSGFEAGGAAVCPPVVENRRELQARAAEELALLPDGSAIVEMMSDYAVMRDQVRG